MNNGKVDFSALVSGRHLHVHRHSFISAKIFETAIFSGGVLKSPAIIQTPFQFLTKLISSARMDELGLVLIEVPVFR